MEVGLAYYGNEEEDMIKKENHNIIPFVHLSPRAHLEMLELGEGDVMEELDQELTGDVLLV